MHRQLSLATFPFGTLAVNLAGSLAIGIVAGLVESRQLFGPELRAFVLIGVTGGFTTSSACAHETLAMLRDGEQLRAAASIAAHVIPGLALAWLGYSVAASR